MHYDYVIHEKIPIAIAQSIAGPDRSCRETTKAMPSLIILFKNVTSCKDSGSFVYFMHPFLALCYLFFVKPASYNGFLPKVSFGW